MTLILPSLLMDFLLTPARVQARANVNAAHISQVDTDTPIDPTVILLDTAIFTETLAAPLTDTPLPPDTPTSTDISLPIDTPLPTDTALPMATQAPTEPWPATATETALPTEL